MKAVDTVWRRMSNHNSGEHLKLARSPTNRKLFASHRSRPSESCTDSRSVLAGKGSLTPRKNCAPLPTSAPICSASTATGGSSGKQKISQLENRLHKILDRPFRRASPCGFYGPPCPQCQVREASSRPLQRALTRGQPLVHALPELQSRSRSRRLSKSFF